MKLRDIVEAKLFKGKTAATKFISSRQEKMAARTTAARSGLNRAMNMLSAAEKGAAAGQTLAGPFALSARVRHHIDRIAGVHDAHAEVLKHTKRLRAYDHLQGHYGNAKYLLSKLKSNDKTPISVGRKAKLNYGNERLSGSTLYHMAQRDKMAQAEAHAHRYADHLARTAGTPEFEHHYKDVKKMLKHQVHMVVTHLTGKTPKSWSKDAMLGKIYAEHGRKMLDKN